jgi:hypothetical protein
LERKSFQTLPALLASLAGPHGSRIARRIAHSNCERPRLGNATSACRAAAAATAHDLRLTDVGLRSASLTHPSALHEKTSSS